MDAADVAIHGANFAIPKLKSGLSREIPLAPTRMSGVVYRQGHAKPWYSMITVEGKSVHLGTFTTETGAHQAYLIAKRRVAKGLPPKEPFAPKGAYPTRNGSFKAEIKVNGRVESLGTYPTEQQAHEAFKQAKQRKRKGLPVKVKLIGTFGSEEEAKAAYERRLAERPKPRHAERQSPETGVTWNKAAQKWRVRVSTGHDGKSKWYGLFDEHDAAVRAMKAATEGRPVEKQPDQRKERGSGKGCYMRCGRFLAYIKFEGKNVYLGMHDTEGQAHQAYLDAVARVEAGKHPKAHDDSVPDIEVVDGMYRVRLLVDDDMIEIGSFATRDEARKAYWEVRA